ncbi:MAG TPA: oligosaccharide flippase family protein [Usitatibacter sp.]|nr:oligosaccharide flippase family protein [Usitatibacter sp.]
MSPGQASLERRAVSLGTAYALDYGLQFLLPIVLTRALDANSFGEYRLLWLAVSTLLVIMPMCMPQSLYYFMPRSHGTRKRLFLNQCLLFLAVAGLASALILSPFDPWLPQAMKGVMTGHGAVVPIFVALWIFSWVLDVLPTVDERVHWQAKAIVGLSALRAVSLSAAAILTRDVTAVFWVLAAFAAFKVCLLLWYVRRHHGLGGPWLERAPFAEQIKQSSPFALSGMLNGFRLQGDQWIVATLFTVSQFASFSVATVVAPLVQMFRQSVNHVFLPSMSRHHSRGDFASMLALNGRANAMVALLVYPMLAFAFVFAEPLIALVYTPTYLAAAPVMRLYIVGLLALVVELSSILFLLKQGVFAARVNALVLALGLPLSYFGAINWGLTGAAIGSVLALYSERAVSLARIAKLTGTPVAKLQDWTTLAGILAAAGLAALAAGSVLRWTHLPPLALLASGGAILAVVYPAALLLMGQRRCISSFIASLRHPGPRAAAAE